MSTANLLLSNIRGWSWLKRLLLIVALCTFLASSFLFLTPSGDNIRVFLAKTVITTQHRDWAWIFVGANRRDVLVKEMQSLTEKNSEEKQDIKAITYVKDKNYRSMESLVKVEDISGQFWKGKRMYVYDPTTIRVVVPAKQGEGERITSMVQRTEAVAGVNGGGFVDPDGLGNGFAPIGVIMSGGDILYTDQDGSVPQHIVAFTKEGTLIIGKYTIDELLVLGVTEAVSFYPRVIANGKPLITSGDGGWGRAPRTAVGQKADGTVIFIVIDGRQTHSVGATLKEVQDLFLADGVINAGFLDGGASSEMVVGGDLITQPSSRYGERRLPSAFLVFDHPEDVKVDSIWDGVTKIDAGGAYDHPDFIKEQATKKNQPKASSTPNPTKSPAGSNVKESTKPGTTNSPATSSSPKPGTSTNSPVPIDKGSSTGSTPSSSVEPKPNPTASPGPTATGSPGTAPSPTVPVPSPTAPEGGTNTTTNQTGGTSTPPAASPKASVKPVESTQPSSSPTVNMQSTTVPTTAPVTTIKPNP